MDYLHHKRCNIFFFDFIGTRTSESSLVQYTILMIYYRSMVSMSSIMTLIIGPELSNLITEYITCENTLSLRDRVTVIMVFLFSSTWSWWTKKSLPYGLFLLLLLSWMVYTIQHLVIFCMEWMRVLKQKDWPWGIHSGCCTYAEQACHGNEYFRITFRMCFPSKSSTVR